MARGRTFWLGFSSILIALPLIGAADTDEAELWTETIRGKDGQFAISIDGKLGSVNVMRGDQRALPNPGLRVRLFSKGGEAVVLLEQRERDGAPPLFNGTAKGWSGPVTGFILEKADGKSWIPLGKFHNSAHDTR